MSSYIGKDPAYGVFGKQAETGDGATVAYTLSYTTADATQLIVSVGGVLQEPRSAYTINVAGSILTFTEAPATGSSIWIIWLGRQLTGPRMEADSITAQSSLVSLASDDTFVVYDESTGGLKKVEYQYIHTAVADMAANSVKVRDAATSGAPSDKVVTDTQILIGDGTGFTAAALSGEVTMANTGAVTVGTIASLVATTADINAGTVDAVIGGTTPAAGTFTAFTSTGIDDNADALAITIDSAEKVGINQATPTARLHVKTDGASSTPFRLERSGGSGDEFAINMQGDNRMWMQMYQAGTEKIRFDVGSPSFISDKLNIGSNATATTTLMVSGDVKTTGQAYFADTTLTFDATQDWDVSTNQVCTLTLTANTTFDAPTNMVDGAFYSILMIQDGTGGWTASWNTVFKWAAATAPVLTTTASAKDIFVFRSDGTNMYEVGRQLNVS